MVDSAPDKRTQLNPRFLSDNPPAPLDRMFPGALDVGSCAETCQVCLHGVLEATQGRTMGSFLCSLFSRPHQNSHSVNGSKYLKALPWVVSSNSVSSGTFSP